MTPIIKPSRELRIKTPRAYRPLYDPPIGSLRYRTFYGGRGAGRSWQVARALIYQGTLRPLRILCSREWQNSMRDSVIKVLSDQVNSFGLARFFDVQATTIIGRNGTEFMFKGLRRDIGSIKSTEGIDIVWIEEAQSVSEHSWRELTPTIRKDGSEIWTTFNTGAEDDPTYVRLVAPTLRDNKHYDPEFPGVAIKTSWRDNPFFPKTLDEERKLTQRRDPDEYDFVWEGNFWKRSKAQVLNGKWRVMEFEPQESWGHPFFGVDFGFSTTPAVIVKCWVHDSRLYVEYAPGGLELSESGLEGLFDSVPRARDYLLHADAARPETIAAMRARGFQIEAAPKWPGSIEDGISHLRSYEEIVIHPRCERAIQQARLWRYKTRPGASGDPNAADAEILPHLQDGNDDVWDATRYALVSLIRSRRRPGFLFAS